MPTVSPELLVQAAVAAGLVRESDEVEFLTTAIDSPAVVFPHLHTAAPRYFADRQELPLVSRPLPDIRCDAHAFRLGGERVRAYVGRCDECGIARVVAFVPPENEPARR